jgi:hypothetical protein
MDAVMKSLFSSIESNISIANRHDQVIKAAAVGTVHTYSDGKKYQKQSDGTWKLEKKEKIKKELPENLKNELETNRKYKRLNLDKNSFDENGNYIIYHGTNKERAKKILENGLNPMENGQQNSYTTTTNKNVAKRFAEGYSGDTVLKLKIPFDKIPEYLHKGGNTSVYQEKGNDTQHALLKPIDKKYISLESGGN